MKTIKNLLTKICAYSIAIASMASCDMLDTKPYDFITPVTFYANESDCNMALAGVYYTISKEDVYGSRYNNVISNVDDMSCYFRQNQTNAVVANSHSPSNTDIYNTWTALYAGINNANVLLDNIDKAAFTDEKARARIKAETKFLRAYYHFLLVQAWYEVPIRKATVDNINASEMAPTPHAEALDWIISEMEDCIDFVDDSAYDKSPSHVKKTVVQGILARVCLWRAGEPSNGGKPFYTKAAKYANDVYASQKHDLNPNLETMWRYMANDQYDVQFNESMWEAEFIGIRDDGKWTEGKIGTNIGNLQENTNVKGKGVTYAFYASSLLLWDLYKKDPADKRATVYLAPYKLDKTDKVVFWKDTELVDRRCGKFRREWELGDKQKNYTYENFPILRYSDVLLMLAEAENEVNNGPTSLAYDALKKVRDRAGVAEIKDLNYADFQQIVRDERARELCFEATRKYDLIRWGIYESTIKGSLAAATADKRWKTGGNYEGTRQFIANTDNSANKKHRFLPIPEKELAVNGKLQQNKYWK